MFRKTDIVENRHYTDRAHNPTRIGDIGNVTSSRRNRFHSGTGIPDLVRNATVSRISDKTAQRRLSGARVRGA